MQESGPFLFFLQIIVADMRKLLAKNPQGEQHGLHRRVFPDDINPENQALMVRPYAGILEIINILFSKYIDVVMFEYNNLHLADNFWEPLYNFLCHG